MESTGWISLLTWICPDDSVAAYHHIIFIHQSNLHCVVDALPQYRVSLEQKCYQTNPSCRRVLVMLILNRKTKPVIVLLDPH